MALVALAGLLVGLPAATPAAAKKRTISATVNGKHYRWSGRLVQVTYGPSGLIAVATKIGGTKTIGFGCAIDFAFFPAPTTRTDCNANFLTRRGTHLSAWLAPNGVRVAFDTFDGKTVRGNFSGTLAPAPGNGSGPRTVEGTFRAPVAAE